MLLVNSLILLRAFSSDSIIANDNTYNLDNQANLDALLPHWPFARGLQTTTTNTTTNATIWRHLRYRIDYSQSEVLDKDTDFYLKRLIIDPIMMKLKQMIKINGPSKIPAFNSTLCTSGLGDPDTTYKRLETDSDFVLFVMVRNTPQNIMAYSSSCSYSTIDKRPLAGFLVINSNYIYKQYSAIEILRSAYLHEIFHILGFNSFLYDHFPIGKEKTYVKEVKTTASGTSSVFKIILPGLVNYGKKYFNCPTFDGLVMENEGGASANSHFEQRILNQEIMTSLSNGIGVLSFFTLHFLNDIGWYQVNFGFAQEYNWGRNKGCKFVSSVCDTSFSEFCKSEYQIKCSDDRKRKTVCQGSNFSDGCALNTQFESLDCVNTKSFKAMLEYEEPGKDSFCLDVDYYGNLGSGCFKTYCEITQLRVAIGLKNYYCNATTTSFVYNEMVVKCPSFNDICKPLLRIVDNIGCVGGCGGNGVCLVQRGVCECYTFYSGTNCQTFTPCAYGDSLCQLISPAISSQA